MTETAIADHALIGDLQTAALVTTDGSVDWLCLPRFDSPSVFGALLDDERGGHFRIRPAGVPYTSKQMYLPDTAVLVTRFFTDAGLGQVMDFMPPAGTTATDNHRIVRIVQCVRGRMTFEIDVAPGSTTAGTPTPSSEPSTAPSSRRTASGSPCTSSARPTTSGWPR